MCNLGIETLNIIFCISRCSGIGVRDIEFGHLMHVAFMTQKNKQNQAQYSPNRRHCQWDLAPAPPVLLLWWRQNAHFGAEVGGISVAVLAHIIPGFQGEACVQILHHYAQHNHSFKGTHTWIMCDTSKERQLTNEKDCCMTLDMKMPGVADMSLFK